MSKYKVGDRFWKDHGDMRELEVIETKFIGHTTALGIRVKFASGMQSEYSTNAHRLTRMINGAGWNIAR